MAIKITCAVCKREKLVNTWRDYYQFDGQQFCSKQCADKYQRERTKRDISYYEGSMDQAGKYNYEVSKQRYAVNDLPL
ncbi:eL24 family ribosomal protein [Limosilactobacillus caecicola]|uniref:hypothetical protein n=1 Tax=Limosilactobacillus caecicola TaxID=2941332 RepID=UPI00203CCC63|nr:hypothetical protein [Limosilactobacillus caecicola]